MRLDDLIHDPEAWVRANEALWERARLLAERHPRIDLTDLYHALVNLERTPEERLRRSLAIGRGLARAHREWAAARSRP